MTQKNEKLVLDRIIGDPDVMNNLDALERWGVFERLFPEVQAMVGFGDGIEHKDLWWHTRQVVAQCKSVPARYAALFHDIGKPRTYQKVKGQVTFHGHENVGATMFDKIVRRTRLWGPENWKQAQTIRFLIANSGRLSYDDEWTDSGVRRLITDVGDSMSVFLEFVRADCTSGSTTKRREHQDRINDFIAHMNRVKDEDALRNALPKGLGLVIEEKFGYRGPALGNVMKWLKEQQRAGNIEWNRDADYYIGVLENRK